MPIAWHDGELAVHRLLKAPTHANPTSPGLPGPYGYRVALSPLLALGTLDADGRPWTTVWGGERGSAKPIAAGGMLGVSSRVDGRHDPVFAALWGKDADAEDGTLVRPRDGDGADDGKGKLMSALSIDLETRDRVKLAGRMVAGAVTSRDGATGVAEVQAALHITETLGNCPKYLNKKAVVPNPAAAPVLASDSLPLPPEAVALLGRADLFFLSSAGRGSMDTNHRGGAPGLIRVARNDADGVVLVYPEFSGNRLYQTLGNLHVRPLVGIAVPDFETADVLYLTGETSILVGAEASALLPRTKLAVKITVKAARFVKNSLPFRASVIDYSPYNPRVRRLATEQDPHLPGESPPPAGVATATFVRREVLSPSVARFTFRLEPSTTGRRGGRLAPWEPGQHVTMDFGPELDNGWSHMRDDDPQSLNDDFVRTFTVSSLPPPPRAGGDGPAGTAVEMQITAKRHGPATGLLWTQNPRAGLELPVLGFGGEEKFRMPTTRDGGGGVASVFVAGGVGITPLLAQGPGVIRGGAPLRVLWSLRAADLGLAVDSAKRIEGLGEVTTVFVTGARGTGAEDEMVRSLEGMGVTVVKRRMERLDVVGPAGEVKPVRKFYLCAGPEMLRALKGWLEGEDHVWEDFEY